MKRKAVWRECPVFEKSSTDISDARTWWLRIRIQRVNLIFFFFRQLETMRPWQPDDYKINISYLSNRLF